VDVDGQTVCGLSSAMTKLAALRSSAAVVGALFAAGAGLGEAASADAQPVYSAEMSACRTKAGSDGDRLSACTEVETARQDKALNQAYARLQSKLNDYQKEALAKSERVWIEFRDAECAFDGSVLIGGPLGIEQRAQRDAHADCIVRETAFRAQTLEKNAAGTWDWAR